MKSSIGRRSKIERRKYKRYPSSELPLQDNDEEPVAQEHHHFLEPRVEGLDLSLSVVSDEVFDHYFKVSQK